MPQAAIAAAGAGVATGTVTALGLTAGSIGAAFVTVGVSYAFAELGARFAPDPQLEEQTLPGTQLSFRDPKAPRETVFGTVRKGGPIVFMAPSGVDNEWLHLVIVLAAHECTAIGDAYFNGVSEHELLQSNTRETVHVVWQRTHIHDKEGGFTGVYPDTFSVELEGVSFSGASVQDLVDQINAHADIEGITARLISTTRPGVLQYAPEDATLELVADSNHRDLMRVQAQESTASCRIFVDKPFDDEQDAFKIWRHTGSDTQAADAELIRLFSEGRKARVVVKWDSDRDTLNLTVNDQGFTGSIADLIAYFQGSALAGTIEVRQQGDAELVLEHTAAGEAIITTSTNTDFSREIAETAVPAWTAAHQGKGLCYAHVRLARRSEVWGNRAPNITFDVQGKALYDPRTDSTAHSDNWALVIRDYLVNTLKTPTARIDDDEFAIAATICDEAVTLDNEGRTQARYTLNGVVTESEQPGSVLVRMQEHGGRILRRRGRWTVSPWIDQPALPTITEDEHLSIPQITLGHRYQDTFNTVVANYAAEDTAWQTSPAPPVTSALYVAEDGRELSRTIDLRFSDGSSRSQRLARIVLEEHRQGITVQMSVPLWRVDCEEGRVVGLDHERWGWSGKLFLIERAVANLAAEPSESGPTLEGGIALTLREYAPGAYDWNLGFATLTDLAPNTSLSPARYVEAPVGLIVSTVPSWYTTDSNSAETAKVLASWRAPVLADVSHYEVQWRSADTPTWTPAPTTRTTNVVIGPVPDSSAVDLRVRAVGMQGRVSRWATATDVPVNSVAALVGEDGEANVTLSQTAPSEPGQGDIWLQTDAADTITARWWWNNSAWEDVSTSRIASAIASAYTVEALVDGTARVFIKPSTDTPLATGEGDLWLQTDTKRLLTWDGGAWVLSSSLQWDDILGPAKADDNAANTGRSPMPDQNFDRENAVSGQYWILGDGNPVQLINQPHGGKGAIVEPDARLLTKHQFTPHATGYYQFAMRLSKLDAAKNVEPVCFVRFYYPDDTHLDVQLALEPRIQTLTTYTNVVYRGFATGVTVSKTPVGAAFGVWNSTFYGLSDPSRLVIDTIEVSEPSEIVHIDSNIADHVDANGALVSVAGLLPSTVIPNHGMVVTPYGTGISGSGNFRFNATLELLSRSQVYTDGATIEATVQITKRDGGSFVDVFNQVVASDTITKKNQTINFEAVVALPDFAEQLADDVTGGIANDYLIFWRFSLPNAAAYPNDSNPPPDHPYNPQVMVLRYTTKVTNPLAV